MSEKIFEVTPGTFPTAREIPLGGVIPSSGSGVKNKTGSWRTQRPILNREVCTDCLLCWLHCPDDSILVEDTKVVGIDIDHCKGCGICSAECGSKPVKAMTMKQGGRYEEGETFAKHTV
jgi:2-oxoacid:acceptor oxidoreductase delta subunit (pyruvate/2-ketoisovalerate family)